MTHTNHARDQPDTKNPALIRQDFLYPDDL